MYDAKALAKDETAKKKQRKRNLTLKKLDKTREKIYKRLNLKTKERRRAMARAAITKQKEADKEADKILTDYEG